jgi:DNA-binding XRE family transcriptional regulator
LYGISVRRLELARKLRELGWSDTSERTKIMMLVGRVFREGPGWSAHCDAVGVYTQGPSRKQAVANLAEAIELQAGREGMKITVLEPEVGRVFVSASEPSLLAAEVLKHQREIHGLSIADVAKKLGAASANSYAAYEQGKREPSLSKFRELLQAVAPEMTLLVTDSGSAGPKRKSKPVRRRVA